MPSKRIFRPVRAVAVEERKDISPQESIEKVEQESSDFEAKFEHIALDGSNVGRKDVGCVDLEECGVMEAVDSSKDV
eukprot:TRINITY_DN14623_c0_g1_i1.p2 TRINITY_DN14623_c0_g1~~TRINITY_DN14623_c0_g1_i1.p2  ORF type:complete len:77 (+),score=21.53 TRINITY_DN14623_c0_g1_i1:164-394(+)